VAALRGLIAPAERTGLLTAAADDLRAAIVAQPARAALYERLATVQGWAGDTDARWLALVAVEATGTPNAHQRPLISERRPPPPGPPAPPAPRRRPPRPAAPRRGRRRPRRAVAHDHGHGHRRRRPRRPEARLRQGRPRDDQAAAAGARPALRTAARGARLAG